MNRRFSRSPSYCAPRSFLGAVKAVTLIKQGTLMNWRRYREALLLRGERPGIRVVRLIHRDSVWMIFTDKPSRPHDSRHHCAFHNPIPVGRRSYPDVLLLQQLNSVSNVLKRHDACCPALALPGGPLCPFFSLTVTCATRIYILVSCGFVVFCLSGRFNP
jgi:hypothetical protein